MKKILLSIFVILFIGILFYFNQDRTKIYPLVHKIKDLDISFIYEKDNLIKVIYKNKTLEYILSKDLKITAKKVNNKIKEKYLWLAHNQIHLVLDKNDKILQKYNYKNKNDILASSMEVNGKEYFLIYNKMNSLKLVLDENRKIIKILKYDSSGNITLDTNKAFKVMFSYGGGFYDEDTGLIHFQEGIYFPKASKWISKINDYDIIENLKQLNETSENDVYECSATLDTYYHSFLCTSNECGGLYANDYLNYFNGTGEVINNSRYFNQSICKKVAPKYKNSDELIFSQCVKKRIQERSEKYFDALTYNCHDEVDNTLEECSIKSQKKESL